MESMNKAIKQALKTWYPKDHPLHYELHHPLGKLVGEWGELLDDYMKHLYKPGYEWNPKDELVDVWYYIRILAYQIEVNLTLVPVTFPKIDYLIACAISEASDEFRALARTRVEGKLQYIPKWLPCTLNSNYSILAKVCNHFDLTIDQLTKASWEKLKPGSERGEEWMKERKYGRSENKGAL